MGGYSEIFKHRLRRLGSLFGVQNFEFQYFWVFRKMNISLGMKIFRCYHKVGLGVISMHFLKVKVEPTEWGYFWGSLKFQIYWDNQFSPT